MKRAEVMKGMKRMREVASGKKKAGMSTVMMLVAILILMFAGLTIATDKFFTLNNLQNLIRQTAIYGVIAIGMTLVIISAGIDLSVGAVVGLSGVLTAMFMGTSFMSESTVLNGNALHFRTQRR